MKYWQRPHKQLSFGAKIFHPCGSDSKATFAQIDHSVFHLFVIHQLAARDRIRHLNTHAFGTAAKRC